MAENDLFELKNSFYIGNYQQCSSEAQKLHPRDESIKLERDFFLYRALISQRKYGAVQSQIKQNAQNELKALKLLARIMQDSSSQIMVLDELEALVSYSSVDPGSPNTAIAAAAIFAQADNYESALKVLHYHDGLECRAQSVHCYLAINRIDLARKELKTMQENDDDHTLTQLAQAWLHIATGGEKLQDAYYIYQELIDKNTSTAPLLAGQAACFLGQMKTEEAAAALQEAAEKDPHLSDTLINNLVLSHHTQRGAEETGRYLAELTDSHKDHQIVKSFVAKEEEFDRIMKQYSPSVFS